MRFQHFKLNDNCIYIYDNCCLEIIVHTVDEILHVTLLQTEEGEALQTWSLYCLTKSGCLYRLCRDEVKCLEDKTVKPEDNQKIFSELLSDDEDEGEDDFGIPLQFSTEPVYQLQPCHQILQCTYPVRGLCVIESFIAIVTVYDQGYAVCLYENKENFVNKLCLDKDYKILNFYVVEKGSSRERGTNKVLIKTANTGHISSSKAHSTDAVMLDESVSKVLFWMDAVLLNAPTILLCVPGGSVYFTSTLSFSLHQPKQALTISSTRYTDGNPWKLLCDTASTVIEILTLTELSLAESIKDGSNSGLNSSTNISAIAVCCRSGQILVFMLDKFNQSEHHVSDIILTGPVSALCCHNNRLYHSTDGLMYETSLSASLADGTKRPVITVTQTKMYKQAGAVDMFCSQSEGSINHKDAPCIVTCATSRGAVKTIKSMEFGDNICPVSSGQIRDVLFAMDKLDKERQQLQAALQSQDHLLQQINIAAYLMQKSFTAGENWDGKIENKNLLPCHCEAKLCQQYGSKEIQFCVELTNQTEVPLSHDWKFLLTITPPEPNLTDCYVASVTQTLKDNFKPGDSFTITAKIEPKDILPGFKVSISAVLDLTNQTNSTPFMGTEQWSESAKFLSAQVYSHYTDVMFFMVQDTFESRQKCIDMHGSEDTRRIILRIARGRPLDNVYKDDVQLDNEPGTTAAVSNTTVCLGHVIHMKERTFKKLQRQYSKGLCCILQYLLRDSPSVQPQTGSDISILSMLGQQVHLSVTKLTPVAIETTVNSVDLEVKVRGEPSIAATVHAAVVRRVKVLQDELSYPAVGVGEMKKKLYKLQELQEEVQTYSQHKESKQDWRTYATLYERLRSLKLT